MTNNLNKFGAQGARYMFWALWDSASPNYIAGTSGTLANTEDSGMGRLLGVQDFAANTPAAQAISRTGDNGVLSTFMANPSDSPSGNQGLGSFDQTFDIAATARLINAEGPHDISISTNRCYEFKPLFLVINSPASSDESGSIGEAGWQVQEYFYVFAQPMSVATLAQNTPHAYTHTLVFNERGILPYGETITDVNYGVTQGWKSDPYWSPYPVTYHTYVGDGGASQTVTLDETPTAADGDAVQVWDNASKLVYTTNYAVVVATKVLTFVGTDPAAGQFGVIKYQFVPGC